MSFLLYTDTMKRHNSSQSKFIFLSDRKPVWPVVLKLTFIYMCFGLLWILISDSVVNIIIREPELRANIGIFKGILFVLISTIFQYLLLYPALKKLSDNEQVILEKRNELKTMLYYDHLTGLSNRRKLLERLPDYLDDGTSKGKALIYLDIDDIKLINDTLGHPVGDRLIIETSQRLARNLIPPDELFRIGGDELVILTTFSRVSSLKEKAESILKLFDEPFLIDTTYIHSTVSVGISLYPIHSDNADELLKYADMAMFHSKKTGKNCSVLYNANMLAAVHERATIGEHLHTALEKKELELYYQPQINTETRSISGFEALLRWHNPILGKVPPDKFIPIAEETHLIIQIGEQVLRQACKFIHRLHQQGYTNLNVSVNISMIQLLQDNFAQMVFQILEETETNPARLEVEITESILLESQHITVQHLTKLREKGISIALDDFGKGYSSLSYLDKLPISTLKIDKTFIDNIVEADKDTSITGNIVKIGKKLGLTVIAEGVENETQLAYLANQKCDRIQGWVFSKALPEDEAEQFAISNLKPRN